MAKERLHDLTYGQVGDAVYDPESKEWSFNRRPGQGGQIIFPLGISTTAIPATLSSEPEKIESYEERRKTEQETLKYLRHKYPELVPATSFLFKPSEASEQLTSATSVYDPTISDRFAFGLATDYENQKSGGRTVQIGALVSGGAGDTLLLVRLEEEKLSWPQSKGTKLKSPTLKSGEQGWCLGNRGPIQQIVFSQNSEAENGGWLAVRLLSSTIIFRPIWRRHGVRPAATTRNIYADRNISPSRLDANPVITVPIAKTGYVSHADISFNPWFEKQFAVIDQKGSWSIWTITGQWRAKQADLQADRSGHLSPTQNGPENSSWHRILWVGSVNTLVVCNRHQIDILNIHGDDTVSINAPDLRLSQFSNRVVDVKRSPKDFGEFFVLTSRQIFWLKYHEGDAFAKEAGSKRDTVQVLMSWKHNRDNQDPSLRMEISPLRDSCLILLCSQLNQLITILEFSRDLEQPFTPYLVSDPRVFDLGQSDRDFVARNCSLQLLPVSYVSPSAYHSTKYPTSNKGAQYKEQGVRFYKLFKQDHQLGLYESLCYTMSSNTWLGLLSVDEPVVVGRSTGPKSSFRVIEHFLADDDEVDLLQPSSNPWIIPKQDPGPWTLNLEKIYQYLSEKNASHPPEKSSLDMKSCLVHLQEMIMKELNEYPSSSESLLELLGRQLRVVDVDSDSSDLEIYLQSLIEDPPNMSYSQTTSRSTELLYLDPLNLPELALEGDASFPVLSPTYHRLMNSFMAPLSDQLPGKLRFAVEKHIRQTAAMLCLSAISVHIHDPTLGDEQDHITSQPQEPQSQTTKGKERATENPTTPYIFNSSPPPSAQPPLLPTPSATPSLHSLHSLHSDRTSPPSSPPLPQQHPTPETDFLLAHLHQYLPTAPITLPFSKTDSEILADWATNSDPTSSSNSSVNSEPTPDPEELKLQERARKYLERTRRKQLARAQNSPFSFFNSSTPFMMTTSQQTVPDVTFPTTSSQLKEEPMPMPMPTLPGIPSNSSQIFLPQIRTGGMTLRDNGIASSSQIPRFESVASNGIGIGIGGFSSQLLPMTQQEPGAFGARNMKKKKKKKREDGF
ncbi:MAG: hypothetical protein M1834_009121 [Cirrosporium novae-zelandiae]|nr:MAG: hypothetical protein M1834_009121 [Cirrosporium novae-zelandiae]